MAIYRLSSYTLNELGYQISSFKQDYKDALAFIGGTIYADTKLRIENKGKPFKFDFSTEGHKAGDQREAAYYEAEGPEFRECMSKIDKAFKAAENLEFSTVSDKGFNYVIDFKKGTIIRKASFSINDEPSVEFVGLEIDLDTRYQKVPKKYRHVALKAEKIDIGYDRLDVLETNKCIYSNSTKENKSQKDFRGREFFRRLLSMLLIPLAVGLMIAFSNEGVIKENPAFVTPLFMYSIFGSITTLFSVKRRFMKNIVPAAIWLAIGIVMPALVVAFSGYLAAIVLLATIITIAVKDFIYNGFYKELSLDCRANAFGLRMLRFGDIVQIVIGVILAVFATGLVDYKVLANIYLVFLPLMSIILLLVILGSVINILKGEYKKVEIMLPQMEAKAKHAVASESLDKAVKAYTAQFVDKTYKIQVEQGALLVKIASTYESGHLSFTLTGVKQPNGNLSDWGNYHYYEALTVKLGGFASELGQGIIQTLSQKEEFKNYLGSFSVDVTLGEVK